MKQTRAEVLSDTQFFGQEKISRIMLKIAPPVMLAQLIQALYNIVDSLFVGRYGNRRGYQYGHGRPVRLGKGKGGG